MSRTNPTADISDQMSALIEQAYRRGYADGGNAMRDNILKAAGAPFAGAPAAMIAAEVKPVQDDDKARAPRGLVRELVKRVLGESPGLAAGEIGERAARLDPRVSPTSASVELRRLEGQLYRIEDGRWFLIGDAEREKAERPTSAHSASVMA